MNGHLLAVLFIVMFVIVGVTALAIDNHFKNKFKRLSEEEIQVILSDIRFLNFKFSVDALYENRLILRLDAYVSNNDNRSNKFTITQFYDIYNRDLTNKKRLLKAVRKSIVKYMIHEIDELFLYKNERIFNPHVYIGSKRKLEINKLITGN